MCSTVVTMGARQPQGRCAQEMRFGVHDATTQPSRARGICPNKTDDAVVLFG